MPVNTQKKFSSTVWEMRARARPSQREKFVKNAVVCCRNSRLQIERSCVKNLSTLIAHSAREINVWHHIIPGMIKEEPQVGGGEGG